MKDALKWVVIIAAGIWLFSILNYVLLFVGIAAVGGYLIYAWKSKPADKPKDS